MTPARGPLTITRDELGAALEDEVDRLRVQTLAFYNVPSDEGKHERYAVGEPFEMTEFVVGWLDQLRARAAAGKSWRIVHIVREPLTAYLRYQFEWGYGKNVQAGQDIRILDVAANESGRLLFAAGDFWVVDHQKVVLMHYAEDGSFQGASASGPEHFAAYAALAELAWESATPFLDWWSARPQYHRDPGGIPAIN